jgi:GntR family transcriptional regulator, carbon starvation induced regulator
MNDKLNARDDDAPTTLVERVHAQLRRDIIEGKHPPGSKLRIEHLKELYGIGGGTCREALTLLQSDSLVTLFGQRGFRVAEVSYADFADITSTRIYLEVEALRQSIEHGDENWEANVVAAFHRLSRADEALSTADPESISNWEVRNQAFHEALISACPSRWIKHFAAMLYNQAERYQRLMLAYIETEGSPVKSEWPRHKKEHADIFDAALKRDVARATEQLTAHIGRPWLDVSTLPIFTRSQGKSKRGRRARGQAAV